MAQSRNLVPISLENPVVTTTDCLTHGSEEELCRERLLRRHLGRQDDRRRAASQVQPLLASEVLSLKHVTYV